MNKIYSQNAQFSEPYSDKLLLNPAYTGISYCPQLVTNYRKQEIYDYYGVSYNQFVKKLSGGIGFMIYNNSQGNGIFNSISASALYSYRLNFRRKRKMQFGFQASYLQESINTEGLIFSDMINPISETFLNGTSETKNFETVKDINFSTGFAYLSKKIRYGLAFHKIDKIFNKSRKSFQQLSITAHFGMIFPKSNFNKTKNNYTFTPEIIYRQQLSFNEIATGLNIKHKNFLTSFWLKNTIELQSITPVFTFGFNNVKYRVLYTYDIFISKYYVLPIHSHQISLTYNISCENKRKNKNTIFCRKK